MVALFPDVIYMIYMVNLKLTPIFVIKSCRVLFEVSCRGREHRTGFVKFSKMIKSNQSRDEKQSRIHVVKSPILTAGTTPSRHYSDCTNGTRRLGELQIDKKGIEDMINDLLATHLASVDYEPNLCGKKCPILSEIIENTIRQRYSAQHKIISVVLIGALRDKGPVIASQSLSSPQNDSFTFVYYKNQSLFAAAAVFVVLL